VRGGYVPMRFEEMMKSKFLSLCVHCWHTNPMQMDNPTFLFFKSFPFAPTNKVKRNITVSWSMLRFL